MVTAKIARYETAKARKERTEKVVKNCLNRANKSIMKIASYGGTADVLRLDNKERIFISEIIKELRELGFNVNTTDIGLYISWEV